MRFRQCVSWVILKKCVHINNDHNSTLSETWHKLLDSKEMSVGDTIILRALS